MSRARYDQDRLFTRDGRRVFRRSFSMAEVRWGVLVGVALAAIAGWVAIKGANPDPALQSIAPALLASGGAMRGARERGALPRNLAGAGWVEQKVARFGVKNLYVKINGRADYYKSFGFKQLVAAVLARSGGKETARMYEACLDRQLAAQL